MLLLPDHYDIPKVSCQKETIFYRVEFGFQGKYNVQGERGQTLHDREIEIHPH